MRIEQKPYGYAQEPGRSNAREYNFFAPLGEICADKIDANVFTLSGAVAGVVGSYCLTYPEEVREKLKDISQGRIYPSKRAVLTAGGVLLFTSYIFDMLDGATARKSKKGETEFGLVADGIVNKIVDISVATFSLWKNKDRDSRTTWGIYRDLAISATMIRSIGIEHDVPISKAGFLARAGRVPLNILSMVYEDGRNITGKVLGVQAALSAKDRFDQIVNSGNKKAIRQVVSDLCEQYESHLIGVNIPDPRIREVVVTLLQLYKLAEVKMREAEAVENRKKLSIVEK